MRLTLIALTTFGFLVAPSVAAAEDCTEPAFSPPSGTRLPPYPTLFVRIPHIKESRVSFEHPHRVMTIDTWSNKSRTRRVELLVERGEARMLAADRAHIRHSDYEVGEYAPSVTTITGVSQRAGYVEFAGQGNPIALRFAWDDGSETLAPTDQNRDGFVAHVGDVPCFGWNISDARLEELHTFVLYALHADGSQKRIGKSRMQVSAHAIELPFDLVRREHRIARQAAYPVSPLPPTNTTIIHRAPWPGWSGALGGLAVVLGAACLRRRRRAHDHEPRYR